MKWKSVAIALACAVLVLQIFSACADGGEEAWQEPLVAAPEEAPPEEPEDEPEAETEQITPLWDLREQAFRDS